jgi:uncharacterized protein (UPF0262 family)
MQPWLWIALGTLAVLVIVEELRLYKAHREFRKKDEIFQAVTESAADMIASVDVKGRRLYNSPSQASARLLSGGVERDFVVRTDSS